MKYWEIIANHLHDAGWSLDWVLAFGSRRANKSGLLTHIATTESVTLRADEKLTAFVELEFALAPQNDHPHIRRSPI